MIQLKIQALEEKEMPSLLLMYLHALSLAKNYEVLTEFQNNRKVSKQKVVTVADVSKK